MAQFNEDGMTAVADNVIGTGSSGDHSHRLAGEGVEVYAAKGDPDARLIRVPAGDGAAVACEKHDTKILPPGEFVTEVVREQDHFSDEERNIYD